MNIKPGKWRMRNGKCAVVEFRTAMERACRWIGFLPRDDGIYTWDDSGAYIPSAGESPVDLIEPWTDKPVVNWAAMPAWAKWVAMDKDGTWFHYDEKPSVDEEGWVNLDGWCQDIHPGFQPSFTGNWRDSLVERPAE